MIAKVLLLFALMTFAYSQEITLRAPSRAVNCGCQCDSFIFRDKYGQVQGNCRSADRTGAQWCFVPRGHTCTDTRHFQGRLISYEACATPICDFIFPNGNDNNGFGEIGFGGFGNGGFGGFGNGRFGGFGNGRFGNRGNKGIDKRPFGNDGLIGNNGYNQGFNIGGSGNGGFDLGIKGRKSIPEEQF